MAHAVRATAVDYGLARRPTRPRSGLPTRGQREEERASGLDRAVDPHTASVRLDDLHVADDGACNRPLTGGVVALDLVVHDRAERVHQDAPPEQGRASRGE